MSSRITIVDVARQAGVAVGTASDALNGKGRVSHATRERVLATATELGFRPHRTARGLPSGLSMAIGMRFDHEDAVPPGSFFVDVLDAAATAAGERGYGLLVSTSDVDETAFIDGLIVVDPADGEHLDALAEEGLPVVTIGRPRRRTPHVPWVDVDHAAAVRLLLEHLAMKARPGPAWLLSQPQRYFFTIDLENAFSAWCMEHDRAAVVLHTESQPRAAAEKVASSMAASDPPALVVTVDERQAIGVHAALTSASHDAAIGSAVDDEALGWLVPGVTAVALDAARHGRQAITMVFDWLASGSRPPDALLPARVVTR
jgi:DNA-binding LacI/PurR family transcriptional regulator